MSKSVKGRFVPNSYKAFVFRAWITSTCGYDSPLNEIYKIILAPSADHAFKRIREFESSQGFDFRFQMIAAEDFSLYEDMVLSDCLF